MPLKQTTVNVTRCTENLASFGIGNKGHIQERPGHTTTYLLDPRSERSHLFDTFNTLVHTEKQLLSLHRRSAAEIRYLN